MWTWRICIGRLGFGYIDSGRAFILVYLQNMPQCTTIAYQRLCLDPETPSPDMSLPNLQFWNCMDYGVVSVDKKFIGSMDFECYTRIMAS